MKKNFSTEVVLDSFERQNYLRLQSGLNKAQALAHIGHWELDLTDNSLYWSDEVYRIFGLEPQEFGATYGAFLKHIHPDDVGLVNNTYMKSLEEKQGYHRPGQVQKQPGHGQNAHELKQPRQAWPLNPESDA